MRAAPLFAVIALLAACVVAPDDGTVLIAQENRAFPACAAEALANVPAESSGADRARVLAECLGRAQTTQVAGAPTHAVAGGSR